MERSQWYVGVPNGVVLCVDHVREGDPCGRLYHSYSKRRRSFSTWMRSSFGWTVCMTI